MNKLKTILTILLALSALTGWAADAKILAQSEGSISFVVDENLKERWPKASIDKGLGEDYRFRFEKGEELINIDDIIKK